MKRLLSILASVVVVAVILAAIIKLLADSTRFFIELMVRILTLQ